MSGMANVDLVGIYDPYIVERDISAGINLYDNFDDLLMESIDYCVIATPTTSHAQYALKAINRGVHVLIEKPVTDKHASALEIEKIAVAKKIKVGVGLIERFNPTLQEIKRMSMDDLIGELYQISSTRQGPKPIQVFDVGVLKDLATHDLDITTWITKSHFIQLRSELFAKNGSHFEDIANLFGRLEKNVLTVNQVNWLSPAKIRSFSFIGEKGMLIADLLNQELTLHKTGSTQNQYEPFIQQKGFTEGEVLKFAISKVEPLLKEHEAFQDFILGKPSDIATLSEAIYIVKLIEDLI
jgi:predicted dehydrogenase